ncbi:MAG: UDP-N-acetylglucosamine--dolichyl-phosphate N-acetylglucosaminephosphotransferase [Methanobacteriota archaeon]|nr:MAG: UDP-N-acetylglucosamine--dolichyl-phosphate N-acetylglucosaminephosphotransferase [Euryarchaeota archaeon]
MIALASICSHIPESRDNAQISESGLVEGGRSPPMEVLVLIASAMVSFSAAYIFLPWLIRSLRGTSLVGKDLNKPHGPLVPEMGGVAVILGFYVGIAVLVALVAPVSSAGLFFAALSSCLGAGAVGLMDDMFRLRKRSKAILPFVLSLPLGAAIYAARNTVLLGVDIGILMALAVPLGVTSASNAANMLEGFNGLGAGLGLIMTSALIVLSFLTNAQEGLFLLFPLLGALSAFLLFNRYPARVFPGDSMTLFMGATIASAAIISSPSLKTFGALLFIPMMVEFFLKLRGHFQGENYGEVGTDGRLSWNGRVESLAHAIMKWKRLREWEIVLILWAFEGAVCLAVILAAAAML